MPNGTIRHKAFSAAADRHDGFLPINDQIQPIRPVVRGDGFACPDKADAIVHYRAR